MLTSTHEYFLTPDFEAVLPWAIAGGLGFAFLQLLSWGASRLLKVGIDESDEPAGDEALDRIGLTHRTRSTVDPYDDLARMGLIPLDRSQQGDRVNPFLKPRGD